MPADGDAVTHARPSTSYKKYHARAQVSRGVAGTNAHLQLAGRLLRIPGTKKSLWQRAGAPTGQVSFAAASKRTRPRGRSARWQRRAAGSSSHMRYPRPARRERKSRDPGSGRQGARGQGGDVRHSVREGARERRGRSSGECGRRGQRARWARRAGGRGEGGRGRAFVLASRPARRSRWGICAGQGGIDSGRRPGRRAGPRCDRGRGDLEAGRVCRGWEPGSVQTSLWSLLVLGSPCCWCARTRARQDASSWEVRSCAPPACRASPGPDCRPCGVRASPSHLNDFVACGRLSDVKA